MPTPLDTAHALRTTADWVRTAPDSERCSGHLYEDNGLKTGNPGSATRWCVLGRLALELDLPGDTIYTFWEALSGVRNQPRGGLEATAIDIYGLWDRACWTKNGFVHARHDRQHAFARVADYLELVATRIETIIEQLEPAHTLELVYS